MPVQASIILLRSTLVTGKKMYPYVCLFISLSIYLSNSMSLSIPIDCNPRVQGRTVEHHFTRATPHHKVILFSHTFLYTHTISLSVEHTHTEKRTLSYARSLSLSHTQALSQALTSSLTSSHKLFHKLSPTHAFTPTNTLTPTRTHLKHCRHDACAL
jgi:hypothetical protein